MGREGAGRDGTWAWGRAGRDCVREAFGRACDTVEEGEVREREERERETEYRGGEERGEEEESMCEVLVEEGSARCER